MDNYDEGVQSSRMQLGVGLGSLHSTLRFDGTTDVDVEMNTVSLSGSWQINDKWSIRSGVGVILDGTLTPTDGSTQNITSGGLLALGLEYLVSHGEGYKPYLDISGFISASTAQVEDPFSLSKTNYVSSDLRLGARASWNIADRLFPYVSTRVFGGPVSWTLNGTDVIGSDIHHYQIAMGTALQLGQIGTFVEWAHLGEMALSAGISFTWSQ